MTSPVSVVIPTRDRPALLDGCLTTAAAALRPGDELIVVDSASRDPAVAEVARRHGATVVRCDLPGASRARNAGVGAARHDVVVFIDDDIRVDPHWAHHMAAAMADPAVGFVTGRISVPPDQSEYQRPVAVNEGDVPVALDATSTTSLGPSANLAVRRSVFERVGGFDEALGPGGRLGVAEDLDFYDRLFAQGVVGRYEPAAVTWHDQWRGRRALLKMDWGYGLGTGARLAKLVRTDRRRARFVLRTVVWRTDLRGLGVALRRREEFAALTVLVRLAGAVLGFARAIAVPVRDGRYVTRLSRT
jgi:glycosyltransferase involved in cell wall biosynthesis